MVVREFKYNGRIWLPHPTVYGDDNFFHAVFGEGQPCFDSDSNFRRRSLLNFFGYMDDSGETEHLKKVIETISQGKETEGNHLTTISIKEIPLISALLKTRLVVFVGDNVLPDIFHPDESLLGNYPWKVKDEVKEVVVHFNQNRYTRLQFYKYEEHSVDSSLGESTAMEVEAEEDDDDSSFHAQTYPKLKGSAGIRGVLYQIDLLTIFLLNRTSKLDSFRLSTENKKTGKFDDVVLETRSNRRILLQAKHKQNKILYHNDLFTSSDEDFSLPKYYLSYQEFKDDFNADVLYLCTNTSTRLYTSPFVSRQTLEEDDPLYVQNKENSYLKFNENAVPEFKAKALEYKDKHLPDKSYSVDIFDDDRIKSFFSKFRLITKYPAKGDLGAVIEELLWQRDHCDQLQTKNCAKYLNGKMLDWYDSNKGRYLNQNTLRIFLGEFRSNNFCEKLCNFQIHMAGNDFAYLREKRLVHIEFRGSYVLNMVKVYYSLYASKKQYLFVSPVEASDAQEEVVRAFEDSSYEVLVACFKVPDAVVETVARKLAHILDQFPYKRIVLITGKDDRLAALLREASQAEYEEVFENITFNDLTEDSQRRLLKSVTHFFESK